MASKRDVRNWVFIRLKPKLVVRTSGTQNRIETIRVSHYYVECPYCCHLYRVVDLNKFRLKRCTHCRHNVALVSPDSYKWVDSEKEVT